MTQVFYETVGAIFLPLVVFAGGGWLLDRAFGEGRVFLFLGLAVAFIVTQILLFRKIQKFSRDVDVISKQKKQSTKDN